MVDCSYVDGVKERSGRIKETTRLIREARVRWDRHENKSCRIMRQKALESYEDLSSDERSQIPQELRVWLRYRSEKYFGGERTPPGSKRKTGRQSKKPKKKAHAPDHSVASRSINSPVGKLVVLASKKGISGLYFGHRIESSTLPPDPRRHNLLDQAVDELEQYFEGERRRFSLPLDARGSGFQRAVWRKLSEIPFGQTRSYGDLAGELDNPGAVRAVGTANGVNPISIIVPCHRVIGKDGTLTGFGGGLDIKRKLLQHEGVVLELPGL